jgi:hypothetical protein
MLTNFICLSDACYIKVQWQAAGRVYSKDENIHDPWSTTMSADRYSEADYDGRRGSSSAVITIWTRVELL